MSALFSAPGYTFVLTSVCPVNVCLNNCAHTGLLEDTRCFHQWTATPMFSRYRASDDQGTCKNKVSYSVKWKLASLYPVSCLCDAGLPKMYEWSVLFRAVCYNCGKYLFTWLCVRTPTRQTTWLNLTEIILSLKNHKTLSVNRPLETSVPTSSLHLYCVYISTQTRTVLFSNYAIKTDAGKQRAVLVLLHVNTKVQKACACSIVRCYPAKCLPYKHRQRTSCCIVIYMILACVLPLSLSGVVWRLYLGELEVGRVSGCTHFI